MFIDACLWLEFEARARAIKEDPDVVKMKKQWHSQWDPMRVPGSMKTELWTERLRVELKKEQT